MSDAKVLLLVEDERLILWTPQEMLEFGGYVVIAATCGVDAITILDSRHPEIAGVVTDVRLGGGSQRMGGIVARPRTATGYSCGVCIRR
jgi:CheY-like chemotaxis protein